MKTDLTQSLLAAALLLSAACSPLSALAQGSLTPPGAPSATMKTLDQIEARIPITNTASLVTIAQPGSYYLTHNLTVSTGDGIDINTNSVTLDLNGYTIASTATNATGTAINLNSGCSDITICNGHIRGGVTNNGSGVYGGDGFAFGITYSGNAPQNVQVFRSSVSGCMGHGINLGNGNATVVEACTVRTVGGNGIFASTVKGCAALNCGGNAINGDSVSDCRGQSSGGLSGIYANYTAQNCCGQSSGYYGIAAATALNCFGFSGTGYGIGATMAQNCYGQSGTTFGISAATAQNCYGHSDYGTGIFAINASFCVGYRSGGTAIEATIATGCYATAGTNNITYKYNMP